MLLNTEMYTRTQIPLNNVDPVNTQVRKTFSSLKTAKLRVRHTIPNICMQAMFSSEENQSVFK